MLLPIDFQFSQGSLQDFVDCRRRFQLRYLEQLDWPAIEAAPAMEHERQMRMGAAFHRLAQQQILGLPAERLSSMASDETLHLWWQNYLHQAPPNLPEDRYPEIVLAAQVGGHRLVAKYDLLAIAPGERAIIVDWKTSQKRPARRWLAERLQTRVYRYLLVEAGAHLNAGEPIAPEQVEMIYWFANHPDDPEHFSYDALQYQTDRESLEGLIGEITGLDDDDFSLTTQERHCRYCAYRSLCQRGVEAGTLLEAETDLALGEDWGIELDLEQIAEIAF